MQEKKKWKEFFWKFLNWADSLARSNYELVTIHSNRLIIFLLQKREQRTCLHASKHHEVDKEKESVTWNNGALVAELALACGGGQEEYGWRCRGSNGRERERRWQKPSVGGWYFGWFWTQTSPPLEHEIK